MKKVLIGLVVVLAVFAGVVATRPDSFSVNRSASIAAPPEVVFKHVADFNNWAAWSPWEGKDPAMKKTHSGVPGTVGSSYAWQGNSDVGVGKMTITEVKAPSELKIKLEFTEPFEDSSDTVFAFKPNGANTDVSWTMSGETSFIGKAFGLFVNMDEMLGKDFEAGLASMKKVAEEDAKKVAAAQAAAAAAAAPAADAAAAPAPVADVKTP